MSAGIVDHETHTRDITPFGGLRHLMPITFAIATLAALSMAGIPLLNGFLSKEMMLEEAAHNVCSVRPMLVPAWRRWGRCSRLPIASALSRIPSWAQVRDDYPAKPHDPEFGLWVPPALADHARDRDRCAPFLAEPFVRPACRLGCGC